MKNFAFAPFYALLFVVAITMTIADGCAGKKRAQVIPLAPTEESVAAAAVEAAAVEATAPESVAEDVRAVADAVVGAIQDDSAEKPFAAKNRAAVGAWTKSHPAVARGTGVWYANGVVADAEAGAVELVAETCGLAANNTVEFLLIGPGSEKGYEAFAQTFAECGEIAKAIEFIGVPRGRIADPANYAFWSKGERVVVETAPFEGGEWTPIENWVLDRRTNAALAPAGFVFTGSQLQAAATDDSGAPKCVADSEQPRSVIATYNERFGVLDVPRRAPQGSVYESYVQFPERVLPEGELLRVRIRPMAREDGKARVRTLALRISQAEGEGLAAVRFSLWDGGEALLDAGDAPALFALFAGMAKDGFDPYVTLDFDPSVTLGSAILVATALDKIDGESGIRVEAPLVAQPYYRAFLPDHEWRERANRASQPWELHVTKDGEGAWKRVATFIAEDWSDPNSLDPKLTPQDIPFDSWDALLAKTKELKGLASMFVFAPADMPLSVVTPAIEKLSDPRFSFHFFVGE